MLRGLFGKLIIGAVVVGGLVVGALVYLGVIDWRDVTTTARVQTSRLGAQLEGSIELGAPRGSTGNSRRDAEICRTNLQRIESAKRSAARARGNELGSVTWEEVLPYLGNERPRCPAGGTYTLGNLQMNARCSVGGNGTVDTADDHALANR